MFWTGLRTIPVSQDGRVVTVVHTVKVVSNQYWSGRGTTLQLMCCRRVVSVFFFFQAEDGIRDKLVLEFRRVLFRSPGSVRPCAVCAAVLGLLAIVGLRKRRMDEQSRGGPGNV